MNASFHSRAVWLAVTLLPAPIALAASPSFRTLGTLDGPGAGASTARAVTSDGSTVVGRSTAGTGYDGYRWSLAGGMQSLGIADPSSGTGALDVADDGSTVLARRAYAPLIVTPGGTTALPPVAGQAGSSPSGNALSADGATAVGFVSGYDAATGNRLDAFRWTAAGGTAVLSGQPAGYLSSLAYGVSGDGSTVVGSLSTTAAADTPMRWTAAGGTQPLPLPAGFSQGVAVALSGDGHVIVGDALRDTNGNGTADQYQPVRWTAGAGGIWNVDALDDLPGDPLFGVPRAASADGSIIVGRSATSGDPEVAAGTDDRAVIWDDAHGLRTLEDVLTGLGVTTGGWTLRSATDVSGDGTVIVGDATDSLGRSEAFVAVVPEPTFLAPLAVTLLALPRRRRSRLR